MEQCCYGHEHDADSLVHKCASKLQFSDEIHHDYAEGCDFWRFDDVYDRSDCYARTGLNEE